MFPDNFKTIAAKIRPWQPQMSQNCLILPLMTSRRRYVIEIQKSGFVTPRALVHSIIPPNFVTISLKTKKFMHLQEMWWWWWW